MGTKGQQGRANRASLWPPDSLAKPTAAAAQVRGGAWRHRLGPLARGGRLAGLLGKGWTRAACPWPLKRPAMRVASNNWAHRVAVGWGGTPECSLREAADAVSATLFL